MIGCRIDIRRERVSFSIAADVVKMFVILNWKASEAALVNMAVTSRLVMNMVHVGCASK